MIPPSSCSATPAGWARSTLIVPNFFERLHIPAASVHDDRAHEMDEAATLDGCSPIRVYWRVMLPMSKPALATVAIFSFMSHWNDLMTPDLLNSRRLYTIPAWPPSVSSTPPRLLAPVDGCLGSHHDTSADRLLPGATYIIGDCGYWAEGILARSVQAMGSTERTQPKEEVTTMTNGTRLSRGGY